MTLASQKLQEELNCQDAENAKLKQQNGSLAERLNELEATVKQLVAQK
jgi:TATA-binding protein-associated factor Taf7